MEHADYDTKGHTTHTLSRLRRSSYLITLVRRYAVATLTANPKIHELIDHKPEAREVLQHHLSSRIVHCPSARITTPTIARINTSYHL